MKGIVKKLLATVLTGAMMVSVFVGSGVEVKAANTYSFDELKLVEIEWSKEGFENDVESFENDVISNIYKLKLFGYELLIDSDYKSFEGGPEAFWKAFFDNHTEYEIKDDEYYIYSYMESTLHGIIRKEDEGIFIAKIEFDSDKNEWDINYPGALYWGYIREEIDSYTKNAYLLVRKIPNSNGSATESKKESKPSASDSSAPAHEHSYNWVIESEATEGSDGVEVYKCSCGDVQARSVIPASQVYVRKFRDLIQNAPANGTVTYDSKMNHTFSDYIIKRLAERTDVTITIDFKWQNADYTMTIPAGVDYAPFFADTENFYGYFCFAQMTGSSIVAK